MIGQVVYAVSLTHGYGHAHGHGGGLSEVLRTMAHAAIWTTVGRLLWSAPGVVVVAGFVLAAGYLMVSRRGRRRS